VLHDLVGANHRVEMARVRLAAHRSGKTYQEQLAEVMDARVDLLRICAMHIVVEDPRLLKHPEAMREYLDAMGGEYQTGYQCVARQQRLDELWLIDQMEGASVPPSLPELLAEPTKAWRQLEDPARFPRLAALLDDAFLIDRFRAAVLAELLVPAITLTTSATTPMPPVLIQIAWPQTVLVALAVAVLPVLAASLTIARRPDAAAELRAVEAA
jgi:hypothetical protein